MLKEQSCRSVSNEPHRRWISDDYFDLIVWIQPDSSFLGFQLCYDKTGKERALTWTPKGGFTHQAVDSGETNPNANLTPILIADGHFPAEIVKREFLSRSAEIDPQIRDLVLAKINEHSTHCSV